MRNFFFCAHICSAPWALIHSEIFLRCCDTTFVCWYSSFAEVIEHVFAHQQERKKKPCWIINQPGSPEGNPPLHHRQFCRFYCSLFDQVWWWTISTRGSKEVGRDGMSKLVEENFGGSRPFLGCLPGNVERWVLLLVVVDELVGDDDWWNVRSSVRRFVESKLVRFFFFQPCVARGLRTPCVHQGVCLFKSLPFSHYPLYPFYTCFSLIFLKGREWKGEGRKGENTQSPKRNCRRFLLKSDSSLKLFSVILALQCDTQCPSVRLSYLIVQDLCVQKNKSLD